MLDAGQTVARAPGLLLTKGRLSLAAAIEVCDMSGYWIVVADNVKARIFSVERADGNLQPVDTLEHPAGNKQSKDINADRPGRAFDIVGHGRHSMGTEVDPVEEEKLRFAKQINDYLHAACNAGQCNRLLLVAGPQLLGHLRKHLDLPPGVSVAELEKNLGQFDAREIRTHLPERL
jgi:protein required for attachment to host cells